MPGITFCSWIRVGMWESAAAMRMGPHTYPPVPITTSGLNCFRMDLALKRLPAVFIRMARFFGVKERFRP